MYNDVIMCADAYLAPSKSALRATSAVEGDGGYVFTLFCLFVYLFVRLCAGYLKKLLTNSDETWWTRWVCDKDELIQFW